MSAMDITCGFPIFGASGYQRQRNCSEGSSSGASTYSGGYDRSPACGCLEAGSAPAGGGGGGAGGYSRLRGGGSPASSCADLLYEKADCGHSEKEEELVFHSEDYGGGGRLSAVVGRDLCAGDLCLLLAAKSLAAKDPSWAIVEVWPRLGIERSLEDHEEVLAVHHDVQPFGRREPKKFVFRKDFSKYEFFHSPQQFFPADMVDLAACGGGGSAPSTPSLDARRGHWQSTSAPSTPVDPQAALMAVFGGSAVLPPIFSPVWVRDPGKQAWSRAFLLLQGQELYVSHKVQTIAKYLRSRDSNKVVAEGGGLQAVASLREHAVYRALNARNQLRAPTEWGLCLRPSGTAAGTTTNSSSSSGGGAAALRCFACESERARLCWLTAMRLAKYGKQLRENYRSFKSKCTESGSSPKEYSSYSVPNGVPGARESQLARLLRADLQVRRQGHPHADTAGGGRGPGRRLLLAGQRRHQVLRPAAAGGVLPAERRPPAHAAHALRGAGARRAQLCLLLRMARTPWPKRLATGSPHYTLVAVAVA